MSLTTVEPRTGPEPGGRSVALGGRSYPVVLPRLTDSRLHVAAVTMTLHILGQTVLGFRVSVPQIGVAVLSPALVEFAITVLRRRAFVWPASAMLTGSGVALILRVVGTEAGDHWTWYGWWYFALIAVGSLATKYLITFRKVHVFNPSNLGLVVAFLAFGSTRLEPLDLWWAPLGVPMVAAYLVIVLGGLTITGRLRLAPMGVVFWVLFTAGIGLLAAGGHCISAAWSPRPVCNGDFWWTIVTSPEIAIFLFFMITDPRTVPADRRARLAFAAAVAVVCTLLIAPRTTEFGVKVGLLGGLTIMSPLRYPLESMMATWPGSVTSRRGVPLSQSRLIVRGGMIGAAVVLLAAAVVVTGIPARPQPSMALQVPAVDVSDRLPTLPAAIVVEPDELAVILGDTTVEELVGMVAENLAIENAATAQGDGRLLLGADVAERLADREQAIDLAVSDGTRFTTEYSIDSLSVRPMQRDGSQTGAAIVAAVGGTAEVVTTDPSGQEHTRRTEDLDGELVLRLGPEGRWLIARFLPAG